MTLIPTCKLSLEVTRVLTDIELAGLKVNRDTLQKIKDDYKKLNETDRIAGYIEKRFQNYDFS